MNKCNDDHDLCTRQRRGSDATYHPTRLIDVGSASSVRLEDDPEKLAGVDYSTLSYCWGPDAQFLKLQRSNYSDLKRGIPIADLPMTLQHSVILTRALGLRYIWIDALCIIQDSVGKQDWLEEAIKMSSVYGRSYINIAASSSPTADGGLFRERDPIAVNGVIVKPHGNEKEGYVITQENHWFNHFQFEPLNLRAWAFQERRLSTRTIHFTECQIYWECCNLCASEKYPDGKPWDEQWSSTQKIIAAVCNSKRITPEERSEAWWSLVWEYSKGKLSVQSDRLIAIAGLAQIFKNASGDEYIAGHWRTDMPHGLMWGAAPHRQSTTTYRAPTWSWASIPDGITIWRIHPRTHPRADILNIEVVGEGGQYGAISGGFLRIRSRMCTAVLSSTGNSPSGWTLNDVWLEFGRFGRSRNRSFLVDVNDKTLQEGREVFCLELEIGGCFFEPEQRGPLGRKWMGYVPKPRGLLLRPTGQKGEFMRVGSYQESHMFDMNFSLKTFRCWQDYVNITTAFRRRNIPSQYYEDLDDKGRYTIRIV